jgi:ABC-type multidrug transport system ATPase subunit
MKGKNGEGKSTTCRILSGLEKIQNGKIIFKGDVLQSAKDFSNYMIYVKQEPELNFITSTPIEELASWGHRFKKNNRFGSVKKSLEIIKKTIFKNNKKKLVWQFSGGQKKILSLLPLELNKTKFWILDEPETGLDESQFYEFLHILTRHKNMGNGAIIVTHNHKKYQNIFDGILEVKGKNIKLVEQ